MNGMRTAAVLEGELPARRIGLVDTTTGRVDRWIGTEKPMASVRWSPDGKRLLATTYSRNPDRRLHERAYRHRGRDVPGAVQSRTGFYVVYVASGKARWNTLPFMPDDRDPFAPGREDVEWSHDGSLVRVRSNARDGARVFHTLDGRTAPTPRPERYVDGATAGLSPDGRHVAGRFFGEDGGINSSILDPGTGAATAVVPGQQLLAWADDSHLIALSCDPKRCSGKDEFRNRLLVVSLGSEKVTPLSGFTRASEDHPGRWTPVFSRR